jgi:hypothetical protein
MKPVLCFILLALFVITMRPSALAATSDTLSCNGGLVSLGDFALDVVKKCGQPAYAVQREQTIVDGDWFGNRIVTTFVIDDWTFNFGPTQFQYRLLLRNGKVWRIENMGYGF